MKGFDANHGVDRDTVFHVWVSDRPAIGCGSYPGAMLTLFHNETPQHVRQIRQQLARSPIDVPTSKKCARGLFACKRSNAAATDHSSTEGDRGSEDQCDPSERDAMDCE